MSTLKPSSLRPAAAPGSAAAPPVRSTALSPLKPPSSGSSSSRAATPAGPMSPQQAQQRMMSAAAVAAATSPTAAKPASPSPSSSKGASTSRAPSAAPSPSSRSGASSAPAGGSSTARPNLLESRAAQNKKELPLNVKLVLQKRPEFWADPMFAHNYPVEVWEHYDVNKDGILNKSELVVLARDLVDRVVSMCRDGMKAQMPKSSDADIDKLIKKELPHILPAKTMEESRKIMAEHIYRELDIDKDGIITRTEFFFNWQSVSQKVLDVNKVKQEALACAIL